MDPATWAKFATAARWILTAELFLGGQARLTGFLTPSIHERAMAKAPGYLKYLSFIPARTAREHTIVIGAAMCLAGGLLCFSHTRFQGALLSMSLSIAGIYSQYRMGISYLVPCINTVLGAVSAWASLQ